MALLSRNRPPPAPLRSAVYPVYPKLGLAGAVLGTGLAVQFVPSSPTMEDVVLPASIMTFGLLLAPVVASLRAPKAALRVENLLAIAPVYWLLLDVLQTSYALGELDQRIVQGIFVAIGLFAAGAWLGALSPAWSLPRSVIGSAAPLESHRTVFKLVCILFVLGMFPYAYATDFNPGEMLFYLGQNRWSAPWSRGQLGGWNAFLDHMTYFGYVIPALTVHLASRSRWLSTRTIVAIVMSLTMTVFLAQGGGRRIVGVLLGAALVVWILEQRRIRPRHVALAAASAGLLLILMQLMLEYRGSGYSALREEPFTYTELRVDDNFLRLGQAIELVPAAHDYVYEGFIAYALVRPIPRVLWPNKPVDPGFDLAAAVGAPGVSLSMSVLGELYVSFGWLAVLAGGWLYGRLGSMLSRLLERRPGSAGPVVYGLGTMALFTGVRSMLELVLMSYAVLAWVFIRWAIFRWAVPRPATRPPNSVAQRFR